jgi:hypothetical protein
VPFGATTLHGSYNRFFVPPPIEGLLPGSAGLTRRIREIGTALPALQPSVEDQFEAGLSRPIGPIRAAFTGYGRRTDGPVHTTVWPDSRIYTYARFDRARAYGLETRIDLAGLARRGLAGYLNYALGRVHFYNPVTGGFVTEADHLADADRFLAPMDQTHTLSAALSYAHAATGLWVGTSVEAGSGTPIGHGGAHEHDEEAADHDHGTPAADDGRVPGYWTVGLSAGLDLLRDGNRRPRLMLRIDVENVGDDVHLIARESEFSPSQYSAPRLVSVSARFRF